MKEMQLTKKHSMEDGVIDQELSQGEDTIETFGEVMVKEVKEGIKTAVDLVKEDSEEMVINETENKMGLEEVKEDPKGLVEDEVMEVVEAMEMAKNQRRTLIHLIRMELGKFVLLVALIDIFLKIALTHGRI